MSSKAIPVSRRTQWPPTELSLRCCHVVGESRDWRPAKRIRLRVRSRCSSASTREANGKCVWTETVRRGANGGENGDEALSNHRPGSCHVCKAEPVEGIGPRADETHILSTALPTSADHRFIQSRSAARRRRSAGSGVHLVAARDRPDGLRLSCDGRADDGRIGTRPRGKPRLALPY